MPRFRAVLSGIHMLRSGMRSVRDYLNQSAEIEDSVLINSHVEGRLPRGIGVTRLRDAPAEWSRQCAMLGLSI
jgi:hypothetical protein